jgi:hypothetical protein
LSFCFFAMIDISYKEQRLNRIALDTSKHVKGVHMYE